jgi:hypothetical protein
VPHFHRDLIGGPAHPSGTNLDHRFDVVQGFEEDLNRIISGLLLDQFHRAVENLLGQPSFTFAHQSIDEFAYLLIVKLGIR